MQSCFKLGTLLVLISFLFSCKNDELSADNFVEYNITPHDVFKIKEIEYNP